MSSVYRKHLENWLGTLAIRADRVLDIGGAQLPIRNRLHSFTANEYRILDLPQPHDARAHVDIVGDLNEPFDIDMEYQIFDMVFCLEVMEYIYNPVQAIHSIARFMASSGTLYITFPHYYPPHEPYENDYLRYTLSGIRKLMEPYFEIQEVIPRTARDGLGWVIGGNALRASKRAGQVEINALGFIIRAVRK